VLGKSSGVGAAIFVLGLQEQTLLLASNGDRQTTRRRIIAPCRPGGPASCPVTMSSIPPDLFN